MANRLARETSPYLLQHAGNPVDWYPWGEEALSRAKAEDRPILLSIGYSACHWCHVMERESFEDDATATVMNEGFVNIKVDREERPDLDSVYMRAVQALTGRGGWPLTGFLTPAGRLFFGGTYFPPSPRQGHPSFRQVLAAVLEAFRNRRDEVERGSAKLLSSLSSSHPPSGSPVAGASAPTSGRESSEILEADGPNLLDSSFRHLAGLYDPVHGGFGPAPKFPQPMTLEFLLRHAHRTGTEEAREMVLSTLRSMARGGIRDHLGGGFHRYSVDHRWLVPHFEKMLYDNGLLARVYLHAFQSTGDPEFGEAATSTLDYVLSDLRGPEGGFYSARDADSEGEEGLFYLWDPKEVEEVLGAEDGAAFMTVYDVSEVGNFEGRNILNLPQGLGREATANGLDEGPPAERMAVCRETLLRRRELREAPFRDEKVLLGWNSFVLRALSEAGQALGREDYLAAARTNASFLLSALRREGRLLRSWKDGQPKIPAFLEDYAGLGNALLTLYEATLESRWLQEARALADQVVELFWEEGEGLFYDSPMDGEALVIRPREPMDNATPSGNSLAVELLLRTSVLWGEEGHRELAARALEREMALARRYPSAYGRLLSALSLFLAPPVEVVLLGPAGGEGLQDLLEAAHRPYSPFRIVVGGDPGTLPAIPLLEGREPRGEQASAYVCRDFTCSPPLLGPKELAEELERDGP